jgi:hypothetical protein
MAFNSVVDSRRDRHRAGTQEKSRPEGGSWSCPTRIFWNLPEPRGGEAAAPAMRA